MKNKITDLLAAQIPELSREEIAGMLSITPAAVRKRLQYAREKLKVEYERKDE